jgi:hypothetical protein
MIEVCWLQPSYFGTALLEASHSLDLPSRKQVDPTRAATLEAL